MLIPIRCFTCGKVLADKYDYYVKEVQKLAKSSDEKNKEPTEELKHFENIRTKEILDDLGLHRYCCRRHMISTVDLMEVI